MLNPPSPPLPFDSAEFEVYCIILPYHINRLDSFQLLQEGFWKQSGEGDLWYRIDSARPDMRVLRHVHIAHKKHTSAKDKQVSWNDNGRRHDAHSFDTSFTPIERAKVLARRVLNIPSHIQLENASLEDIYEKYVLTEASKRSGIAYTQENVFILRQG